MQPEHRTNATIDKDLLRPVMHTGRGWYITVALSGAVFLAALGAFGYQVSRGIGVWGINRPVMWAFDITSFVLWIGISQHAGTLISAILRVTGAEWRRPVTRCAEAITVFRLNDRRDVSDNSLGRPWVFYLWLVALSERAGALAKLRSPRVGFLRVNQHLSAGSMIYLYLPLIPDLA